MTTKTHIALLALALIVGSAATFFTHNLWCPRLVSHTDSTARQVDVNIPSLSKDVTFGQATTNSFQYSIDSLRSLLRLKHGSKLSDTAIIQRGDTVFVYINAPCEDHSFHYKDSIGWSVPDSSQSNGKIVRWKNEGLLHFDGYADFENRALIGQHFSFSGIHTTVFDTHETTVIRPHYSASFAYGYDFVRGESKVAVVGTYRLFNDLLICPKASYFFKSGASAELEIHYLFIEG